MRAGTPSVLHVSLAYPPIMDGVAMVVQNYARWMNRLGCGCTCLVPKARGWREADAQLPIPGIIRCAAIPRPFARPYVLPLAGPVTRCRLRRLQPDIVHIHYPILMGGMALRYARRRGLPVVMTFHTRFADQVRRAVRWRWLADGIISAIVRFFEQADEVWVPSAEAGEVLRSYGYSGVDPRVMGLATDLALPGLQELEARRASGRALVATAAARLPASSPVLLYLGNLIETKNIDLILDALAILRQDAGPQTVVFAGDGYYRSAMAGKARRLGIDDSLVFLGPVTDRDRVKDLLAASDLMLFPSAADTAGIVRIEAAAYALPVVVVDEPCAAAGIEDGRNGFIAENTAVSYARTIRRALADPEALRRVGDRARSTLYRSWESQVRSAVRRYSRIVETGQPEGRARSAEPEAPRA